MITLSVDASTKSIAFGIFNDEVLESYGEIFFPGTDIHARLQIARTLLEDSLDVFGKVDYIAFEKPIMVRNTETAIKMAMMFGVIMSVLLDTGGKLVEITPIAWQSGIGNPVVRGDERLKLLSEHKELKTKSQVNTFLRSYRKDKTIRFVKAEYDIDVKTDNVSDAIALGHFFIRLYKGAHEG